MKIAVVGGGAAAVGALAGIETWAPDAHVTVFDVGARLSSPSPDVAEHGFRRESLVPLYRDLRARHGLAFPPPKSHFGETLRKFEVAGKPHLWKSEHRGGLTNIWGGGMFALADRDLEGWPVTAAELEPYYRRIADLVGVCGEPDALDQYSKSFANRPPLLTSPVIHALRDAVNRGRTRTWKILAGAGRLALETRQGLPHSCVYSGECMLGCPRESIWSASRELDRLETSGVIDRYVVGRVRTVRNRTVEVATPNGTEQFGPFDRVFLTAGCIATTEIVMRSLDIQRGLTMRDNAVLSFPIMHVGLTRTPDPRYFGLCNLSMLAFGDTGPTAQVSVYPTFDHLWRYYTPPSMWSVLEPLWRLGRWRLLLARVFFAGDANRAYDFELVKDQLSILPRPLPEIGPKLRSFLGDLRSAASPAFVIPPLPPSGQATSSHYAATLPYGGGILRLGRHGKLAPGTHVADATAFVSAPAISPTFTIMANACRTVYESLQD